MFTSANVPALFKKGLLKLTQNDDGEVRRVAEATLVIDPFSVELARELGDEIADHLYSDDGRIREELEAIDLRVRAGLQHVSVRVDEAMEPFAILSPVSIKDASAKLVEDKKMGRCWLAFSFVLVFSLEEKAARNFVLDRFGQYLYWSFESLQRELDGIARTKELAAGLIPANSGITSVTFSTPGSDPVTLTQDDAARLRTEARDIREKGRTH